MIYELRIYECVPGRLPDLNKRFSTITLKIWERHGIRRWWNHDRWGRAATFDSRSTPDPTLSCNRNRSHNDAQPQKPPDDLESAQDRQLQPQLYGSGAGSARDPVDQHNRPGQQTHEP